MIVNAGAPSVADFLELMRENNRSHEEFSYFIITAAKQKQQQIDTVNAMNVLAAIGVLFEKIRVVSSKLARDESPEKEFSALVGRAASTGSFNYLPEVIVCENEMFELLGDSGKLLYEVMADPVDYRVRLRASNDEAKRDLWMRMVGMKQLGATATKNLNSTYQALFA